MHIRCLIGKHEAHSSELWNDGYFFSKCRHCECDMVKRGGPWQRVPKGYVVTWRPRTDRDVRWDRAFRANLEGVKLSDMLGAYPADAPSRP